MKYLKKFKKEKRNHNECIKDLLKNLPHNNIEANIYNFNFNKIPKINYNFQINEKYLKNNNYIFHTSDNNLIYNTLEKNISNFLITNYKDVEDFIPDNFSKMIEIYSDGNCFYRALSKFMTDKEDYYHYFRNTIYNYIEDNKDIIFKYNKYLDYRNTYIHYLDYIDKIKELSFYAGETEIITAVKLFKINIYVFEHNENYKYYKFLYKFENENNITYTLILEHLYLDKINK